METGTEQGFFGESQTALLPAHHGHSGRRVRQSVRPELALGCALRLCSSWLLLHWRCGLDAEQLAARSLNQSRAGKGGCASCAAGTGRRLVGSAPVFGCSRSAGWGLSCYPFLTIPSTSPSPKVSRVFPSD